LAAKPYRFLRAACPVAALLLASVALAPAHAEFFDDVRRTFQTDIPHFFQDDIPCAFGGQPTSGAKSSCRGGDRPAARQATDRNTVAPPPRAQPQEGPPAPEYRAPREYP
jgi:hypothetical protein